MGLVYPDKKVDIDGHPVEHDWKIVRSMAGESWYCAVKRCDARSWQREKP